MDPKGFCFPLAALFQREQWRLTAAQHRLADVLGQEWAAFQRLEAVSSLWRAACTNGISSIASGRIDPQRLMHEREHLRGLHGRMEQLRAEWRQRTSERMEQQKACAQAQQRVECYQRARAAALKRYMSEQERLRQVHTDQDWILGAERRNAANTEGVV